MIRAGDRYDLGNGHTVVPRNEHPDGRDPHSRALGWRCLIVGPEGEQAGIIRAYQTEDGAHFERELSARTRFALGPVAKAGGAPFHDGLPPPVSAPDLVGHFDTGTFRCIVLSDPDRLASGHLGDATFDTQGRLDLIGRLARGLAYAHQSGILLGNLRLDGIGRRHASTAELTELWFLDFGQARVRPGDVGTRLGDHDVDDDVRLLARLAVHFLAGRPFDEVFPDARPPSRDLCLGLDPPLRELWTFLHRVGSDPAATAMTGAPATWFGMMFDRLVQAFEWPLTSDGVAAGRLRLLDRLKSAPAVPNVLFDRGLMAIVLDELEADAGRDALAARVLAAATLSTHAAEGSEATDAFVIRALRDLACDVAESTEIWSRLPARSDRQLLYIFVEQHPDEIRSALAGRRGAGAGVTADDLAQHLIRQLRPGTTSHEPMPSPEPDPDPDPDPVTVPVDWMDPGPGYAVDHEDRAAAGSADPWWSVRNLKTPQGVAVIAIAALFLVAVATMLIASLFGWN